MDMSTEIIAIDHGWSQIKTPTFVFTTGVKKIRNKPAFMNDVLEYNGCYYKIGTVSGGSLDMMGVLAEMLDLSEDYISFGKNTLVLDGDMSEEKVRAIMEFVKVMIGGKNRY